ncbi:MAG: sulfurtransferase complex subunit TusC [Gammaproteobacteria bacterium]|nr:sulfurtransferase complex subunit TusC [Gammaproteobacteria bacterium]
MSPSAPDVKRLLFVQTRAPYGSLAGQEGLDALLMGSAFTPCTLLFLGDAVFQLTRDQQPGAIGRKAFTKGFGALAEYGVERICASAADLEARALDGSQLGIEVKTLDDAAVRELFASADCVLSF